MLSYTKTLPTMYFRNNVFMMDIPKSVLYSPTLRTEYLHSFTNVLLKTAHIHATSNSLYTLQSVDVTYIGLRKLLNVPSTDTLRITCNQEDSYNEYLDKTITQLPYANPLYIENMVVHFDIRNEYNELFGYCKEMVDLTFMQK